MTTETRNGQSDIETLTRRGIPLDFGDRQIRVRPRTMKGDNAWMDSVLAKAVARLAFLDTKTKLTVGDIIGALGSATDDMLDLILEYDETDQLPVREWFPDHAGTQQITTAFTTLLEVAYPPFAVSRRLVPADQAAQVIGKLLEWTLARLPSEPTNSPLPSGDTEPPKKSRKRSPAASSGS